MANDWIRSYLTNRKQFVSINGTNSDYKIMKHRVPQGSVLCPLLFLIYINDLHVCIKYSKLNLFADDSSLLLKNTSPEQLQKYINLDLKNVCNWLKANKISLNAGKTELVIFRHPNKKINYEFKIKINSQKIYESNYVKYLGILINSHLNWSYHFNSVSTKLARANGMLSKIRHYVNQTTLSSIYHAIFASILKYGAEIWGQHSNRFLNRIEALQNRALKTIIFSNSRDPVLPLYKNLKFLQISDHIKINFFLLVHDYINNNLPNKKYPSTFYS